MKKLNKILVIISSIIIVTGTSGFLFYYYVYRDNASFIPCVDRPFTSYPVDMDRLENIVPLGNLNPPGHTYPTDHMYFFTNTMTYPDGFDIFAPGNMTITNIAKVTYNPPQGSTSEDYTIEFTVCSHITGRFGHVNNLSNSLFDLTGEFGEEYGDQVSTWEIDGRIYTSYNKRMRLNLLSGHLLGMAGRNGGYDFWLKDNRVDLYWVNKDFSKHNQHTVCPLNYFIDELKVNLVAKLGGWMGDVYPPGYCGRIDFDVSNTAQGIWARDGFTGEDAEEFGLALVYSNSNASMGAISIGNAGNSTWQSQVYYFSPTISSNHNRNFSHVTNDGTVYYYLCNEFKIGLIYTKAILIKMTGNRSLLLQFIDRNGLEIPSDPTSLFNEELAVAYYR
ncbi:MAG: hypothetical protein JXA54_02490 [Candidatus Heimdallarchaeota archaeon]|nr:hypothetical protein [Candidatus Heimdallarchaeota archaeon]